MRLRGDCERMLQGVVLLAAKLERPYEARHHNLRVGPVGGGAIA